MKSVRIIIFAKAPISGYAKTRLAPALGSKGAAKLAKTLLLRCINEAQVAAIGPVELCVAPSADDPIWASLAIPTAIFWSEQGRGDLGERLSKAARRAISDGQSVLLIGTDCPSLTAERLRQAAQALEHYPACMIPVSDGGYALLGLNQYSSAVFFEIPWSTAEVARVTRRRLADSGLALCDLPMLHDIDEPSDLQYLPSDLRAELAGAL